MMYRSKQQPLRTIRTNPYSSRYKSSGNYGSSGSSSSRGGNGRAGGGRRSTTPCYQCVFVGFVVVTILFLSLMFSEMSYRSSLVNSFVGDSSMTHVVNKVPPVISTTAAAGCNFLCNSLPTIDGSTTQKLSFRVMPKKCILLLIRRLSITK